MRRSFVLQPTCLWITGIPAAGKTTLAGAIERKLRANGDPCCILDGDQLREGLNSDLGFSAADRAESVRRAGEAARLIVRAGMTAIVSLISPFRDDRARVRARLAPHPFLEIFVDTPSSVCEARDPKGHYRRARSGQLQDFTGVTSPYEPPLAAELTLTTVDRTPDDLAASVLAKLGR